MDVKLPYVKDIILTKSPPLKVISDNMLKKFSKNVNLKTPGSVLNKNISYLSDKELPTDGLWDGLKEDSLSDKEDITVVLEITTVLEELLLNNI